MGFFRFFVFFSLRVLGVSGGFGFRFEMLGFWVFGRGIPNSLRTVFLLRFLRCIEGVIADYIGFVGFGATSTQRDFKTP